MMDTMSVADALALKGDNNGFGGGFGGDFFLVILFLFLFGGNGFGQNGFGGAATAAAQNELLLGQNFDRVQTKLDSISNGICDGFYALNSSVKDCCCATQLGQKDLIAHGDNNTASIISAMTAGFQRVLDNQNNIEMQHMRDGQMRDYIDKSLCGIVRYPMQMSYFAPCNPCCGGYGNGYQPNI